MRKGWLNFLFRGGFSCPSGQAGLFIFCAVGKREKKLNSLEKTICWRNTLFRLRHCVGISLLPSFFCNFLLQHKKTSEIELQIQSILKIVYNEHFVIIKDILPGLCPEPYFILCLNTKNEARKVKTTRLPALSAARQEFQIKGRKLLY